MKRIITILTILLTVMVVSVTSLVLIVNPNDFRTYMIRKVEQYSGYRLTMSGEMRWHVWPQLSILSGPITITTRDAIQPVIRAENMRLDVNLLPLLSHQLSVQQVTLKGAVVNLTLDSEGQRPADALIGSGLSVNNVNRGWKFDISRLRISESLVVWQQKNGEQINMRDFNLALDKTQSHQAHLEFSSYINRDQRELKLNISSDLDISHYPQSLDAVVDRLDYQIKGADLSQQGISGKAKLKANWEATTQRFRLSDIILDANDSQLNGSLSGTLGGRERPQLKIDIHASNLDLDALLDLNTTDDSTVTLSEMRRVRTPVIATSDLSDNADSLLNILDGEIALSVDHLRWHKLLMKDIRLHGVSEQGLLTVDTFLGKLSSGHFSLPGTVDVSHADTRVTLQPELHQIALTTLLKIFGLPEIISGDLFLNGSFSGSGLNIEAFKRQWRGRAELNLVHAQFAELNFQQLIQQLIQRPIENGSDKVRGSSEMKAPLQQIKGGAIMKKGMVNFFDLEGDSHNFSYTGSGNINLVKKDLDLSLSVIIKPGLSGNGTLVLHLQQVPIPLHIYGPWSRINYHVQVDQMLKQLLREEIQYSLKDWIVHKFNSDKKDNTRKLLKDTRKNM